MNVSQLLEPSHQTAVRPASGSMSLNSLTSIASPVVSWAVAHGIGHAVVSRWLKPIFLREGHRTLQQQGKGTTDSALALAAGLHRVDIQQLFAQAPDHTAAEPATPITHQVLAHWLFAQLRTTIPFRNESKALGGEGVLQSFTEFVDSTPKVASHGFSLQLIAQDMQRQGLASLSGNQVTLLAFAGAAQNRQGQAMEHIGRAAHDLLSASLHASKSGQTRQFFGTKPRGQRSASSCRRAFHQALTEQWGH